MKEKKKSGKARIVRPNNVNYTFIGDIIPTTSDKQKESGIKKKTKFVRNTLKNAKTSKIHYTSNSRSPKSQQNHSPVYE